MESVICPATPGLCYLIRSILLALGVLFVIVSASYLLFFNKRKRQSRMSVLMLMLFGLGVFLIVASFFLVPYLLSFLVGGDAQFICKPCGFNPWPFPV